MLVVGRTTVLLRDVDCTIKSNNLKLCNSILSIKNGNDSLLFNNIFLSYILFKVCGVSEIFVQLSLLYKIFIVIL